MCLSCVFSGIVCSFSGACCFSVHYICLLLLRRYVLLMQGYHAIVLLSGIRSNRILRYIYIYIYICTLWGIWSFPVICMLLLRRYSWCRDIMQGCSSQEYAPSQCSFSVCHLYFNCLSFVVCPSCVCDLFVFCIPFMPMTDKWQTNDKRMTIKWQFWASNLTFVWHLSDICLSFVCHLFVIFTSGREMTNKWQIWASHLSFVWHLFVICRHLSVICHLYVICLACVWHLYKWHTHDAA